MKSVIFLIVLIFLSLTPIAEANDVNVVSYSESPNFPTCLNPGGTQTVYYETGTHGIAGSTGEYTGSDAVYTLDENRLVQCFCPLNGSGIQTNWWKKGIISEDEIEHFKKLGWFYIPDGSAWGLDNTSYMAQNEEYSCKADTTQIGGLGGSSSTPTPTPTNTPSKDILEGVTVLNNVLSFASTGNSVFLYGLLITSFTSLLAALGIYRNFR